ncbi:hypothetical protein MVLG_05373 [Microbotryum lychnidis-dioicae p1A1 Lamole]|uniref:Uncharacterized protein n=1 Tax=Microbotryum lychnidis-dioicae (strain p1A1 Lamole / MvSl-1064) TaxID=683840 RepID=U5HE23_USTV1|nr:hypothetical protein MVLG_05373 [Microbotryum lychnidis-dioicae p1A1 Lamole]|eukprot:KDE04147.1 hypothetical protein MVLG_05373 [Microbotryum lychnidis-dioicae p1A1 Lamole]
MEERLFDPMASDEAKARLQQQLRAYQQEYDRTKELAASGAARVLSLCVSPPDV